MSAQIHPTAIVESGAELGSEVTIGAYSVIGPHVKIAARCQIGAHVVIEGRTSIDEETRVFQFASIGAPPQDLKFHGEPSTLVIGKRNTIREFVTLQPGTEHGNMTTVIGDQNLFMAYSHVAHDCVVGNNNVFANSVALAGHVTVGRNVIFGGMVGVHQFCRVGDFVIIGGGSMINQDIPHYCIGQGDRCRLRGINVIGMKRGGFDEQQVKDIRKTYRRLFSTSGNIHAKIEQLESQLVAQPHVQVFLQFISSSERGIAGSSQSSANESET